MRTQNCPFLVPGWLLSWQQQQQQQQQLILFSGSRATDTTASVID